MVDRAQLIEIGLIRQCSECDFETTERKEMRAHSMKAHNIRGGKSIDRSRQKDVKPVSVENKIIRQRYGRKAAQQSGL